MNGIIEMWEIKIINSHGDSRGQLLPIEFFGLDFYPKRLYTIFGNKAGMDRGQHAHKSLTQLIVCVNGSFILHLEDGKKVDQIVMDAPGKAVLVTGIVWRELRDISEDCVINVLASEPFNEKDYIRSYSEFLKVVNDD